MTFELEKNNETNQTEQQRMKWSASIFFYSVEYWSDYNDRCLAAAVVYHRPLVGKQIQKEQ